MTEWSWSAVPMDMSPEDAFTHCIENDIHHVGRGRIRCECVTYGYDGNEVKAFTSRRSGNG